MQMRTAGALYDGWRSWIPQLIGDAVEIPARVYVIDQREHAKFPFIGHTYSSRLCSFQFNTSQVWHGWYTSYSCVTEPITACRDIEEIQGKYGIRRNMLSYTWEVGEVQVNHKRTDASTVALSLFCRSMTS